MRIVLIKNGSVVNVIDSLLGLHPDFVEVQSATANIGDNYDGNVFTTPYLAPQPPPPALKWIDSNLDPEYWQIDTGPFKDRFDVYGYAGLKGNLLGISRTNDTVYAAFADMTGRLFIDLKARRSELSMVLSVFGAILTSAGKPTITTTMINAILDSYTTDYERHKKGLIQPV